MAEVGEYEILDREADGAQKELHALGDSYSYEALKHIQGILEKQGIACVWDIELIATNTEKIISAVEHILDDEGKKIGIHAFSPVEQNFPDKSPTVTLRLLFNPRELQEPERWRATHKKQSVGITDEGKLRIFEDEQISLHKIPATNNIDRGRTYDSIAVSATMADDQVELYVRAEKATRYTGGRKKNVPWIGVVIPGTKEFLNPEDWGNQDRVAEAVTRAYKGIQEKK